MKKEVNKSHRWAVRLFAEKCKTNIGILPLEDDKLVLRASSEFGAYIKTFKALDHQVEWQRKFIETSVEQKVKTLTKKIIHKYGSIKEYLEKIEEEKTNRFIKNLKNN